MLPGPELPVERAPSPRPVLPPISRWKIVIGAVVVLVLITGAVVALWWAATRGLTGSALVTARLDALKVGLSLGVGSGGVFALYLTWRRQRAIEAELDNRERTLLHQLQVAADANSDATERRVTELYTKAVEQLGADKAAVRLGGLYALERLAQDNPKHRQTVFNVLCAYLRMPYRLPGVPPADDDDQHRHDAHRERVQEREVRLAAQRILAQHLTPRDTDRFWDGIDLDLTGANLIDIDFQACRISLARFDGATFTGVARFDRATFTGLVSFDRAVFTGDAHFGGATADGKASFNKVIFTGDAHFDGAAFAGDPSFDGVTGLRGDVSLVAGLSLAELLDLGDPYEFNPADGWVARSRRDRLRVRFGWQPDGTPVELDLKESTEDGMGPHGLLIGAAGSGRSELLRTLVLALAVTHSPSSLNFALVDFTGAATFARLDKLPHTSAVITNLAEELHLVDRMTDAINGELVRRQELLRAAGNFSSLSDYKKARAAGAPLPEVPTLLVICDEFAELLSARPDFIDMFVLIGRVGRSLGVHLLLASQRLEEGGLRGLETHLSYRIGLRTFSEMESRAVLGASDAFRLPRTPGHGFLKIGADPMDRFRAAYVSGVYRRNVGAGPATASGRSSALHEDTTAYLATEFGVDKGKAVSEAGTDTAVGETLLDILVNRLEGQGAPAHQVWLRPLSDSSTLDQLLPGLITDPRRGLTTGSPELSGALQPLLGMVDRPFEQRRDPLTLDLAGAAGHVLVLGAPQTGKSTTLCTLITSLALTHTPRETQFYCLDFGGGILASIGGLPHVGGVCGRRDTGAVRRTVAEIAAVLAQRERLFPEHRLGGIATYRRLRKEGRFADQPHGDVFLVVDGWQTLRDDFPELEETVGDIAARGLRYGVHVVASCARSFDLRINIRELFASRLELKIGDPIDSIIDRRAAMSVPADAPGRGISPSGHQMLMALPRIDGVPEASSLADGLAALVAEAKARWPGELVPSVRRLPEVVRHEELPATDELSGDDAGLAVGIHERDLSPMRLNFAADPHFLVFADAQSGKTAFLRLLAKRIQRAYRPEEARIIAVDYRRGLLGEVDDEYLLGYGTSDKHSGGLLAEAAEALLKRLPGPDVTPKQLRARSWWQGPEIFVLVDDYDMVATHKAHPLLPLLPLVVYGSDIGLHVVLARRTGGAARGLLEPVLSRLREVGTPGLLMSGDRDEGPLLGGMRPQVLPPGRGWLIDRQRQRDLVQLAWQQPNE
ncbi:type VII secretion protein EccCb [Amycolatopsis sp. WAC 01375]|nr:type VII secretion protein EccCb [Amycolatopsis sp. WAC 01375]